MNSGSRSQRSSLTRYNHYELADFTKKLNLKIAEKEFQGYTLKHGDIIELVDEHKATGYYYVYDVVKPNFLGVMTRKRKLIRNTDEYPYVPLTITATIPDALDFYKNLAKDLYTYTIDLSPTDKSVQEAIKVYNEDVAPTTGKISIDEVKVAYYFSGQNRITLYLKKKKTPLYFIKMSSRSRKWSYRDEKFFL